MNRIKTKYEEIISIENLIAADQIIRKHNNHNCRVKRFDQNWYGNINKLHLDLKHFTYEHKGYKEFYVVGASDGKRRKICIYKDYRDRIVQKAITISSKQEMINRLPGNTYSSIQKRGAHKAIRKLRRVLWEKPYHCFQGDIFHFFEEVDHDVMEGVLKDIFKDDRVLWLYSRMLRVVDKGLVLGAEESQWHANLYLISLDHLILNVCKPEYYFRYCDDIVLLDTDKEKLLASVPIIDEHLEELSLRLKPSKEVFKVADSRRKKGESGVGKGLDFLGYVFYREHTDLRAKTKRRYRRKLHVLNKISGDAPISKQDIIVYATLVGLLKHCDSTNLLNKWKNEYPNYYKRLQQPKTIKVAETKQQEKQLAPVLGHQTGTSEA